MLKRQRNSGGVDPHRCEPSSRMRTGDLIIHRPLGRLQGSTTPLRGACGPDDLLLRHPNPVSHAAFGACGLRQQVGWSPDRSGHPIPHRASGRRRYTQVRPWGHSAPGGAWGPSLHRRPPGRPCVPPGRSDRGLRGSQIRPPPATGMVTSVAVTLGWVASTAATSRWAGRKRGRHPPTSWGSASSGVASTAATSRGLVTSVADALGWVACTAATSRGAGRKRGRRPPTS